MLTFKLIFNIYDNAKSCLKAVGYVAMFLSSMSGVRQGWILLPVFIKLFLSDLIQFSIIPAMLYPLCQRIFLFF